MTKYEYFIKKARGGHLRPEDLRVILMLGRNIEYPSAEQKREAEELIKEKDINLSIFGVSLLKGDTKNCVRYYNAYCKKVTDCLSIEQWLMLKIYYSSISEKRGDE